MSKNLAKILILVTACLLLGIVAISAQDDEDPAPRAEASWCREPVRIPLAIADGTSAVPSDSVVLARGAEAVVTDTGPSIRLPDAGSRVQVTLPESLLHTEWLFARVNRLDQIRVDASLDGQTRRIDAVTVLGSLEIAEEGRTLVTSGRLGGYQRARIDVHTGVDQVLLSNDGASAIDLIGVVGCPAFTLKSNVLQSPTWDPERQRFVARHRIDVTNNIRNANTRALKNQRPASPDTVIDNFQIDLDARAPGFSSATVTEVVVPEFYENVVAESFDGSAVTSLFDGRQPLRDTKAQTFEFVVEYEPNFDDPAWSDGVGSPSPEVRIRGSVDDVAFGLTAVLANSGPQIDTATGGAAAFGAPTPTLDVEHRWLNDPTLDADGTVNLRERISVSNDGETALAGVTITHDLEEIFGAGTTIIANSIAADGPCRGGIDERWTGVGRRVRLLTSPNSMSVGSTCVVELDLTVRPGTAPTPEGTEYRGPIEVSARSGVRSATDFALADVVLSQDPGLETTVQTPDVINTGDGSYVFEGTARLRNIGDQDIAAGAIRIDISDGATGDARLVNAQSVEAVGNCTAGEPPQRARSGFLLAGGAELSPARTCTVRYRTIVRPGALLDDWTITATATGRAPRGESLTAVSEPVTFALPEEPSIEVTSAADTPRNYGNGVHVVELVNTVRNVGDVPLLRIDTSSDHEQVFGDRIRSARLTTDTCSGVSPRWPLYPASASNDGIAQTCEQRWVIEVAPDAQLEDWEVTTSAVGLSTSTVTTDGSGTSEPIDFVENPEITAEISVLSIETIDDERARFRLRGDLANTGDVDLSSVTAVADLRTAFEGLTFQIEALSSDDFVLNAEWAAGADSLLAGTDTLRVGVEGSWFANVIVNVGDTPGPWTLTTTSTGVPPTLTAVSSERDAATRSIPMFSVSEETLTGENNGDGTYTIRHRIVIANEGVGELQNIGVVDDFETVFAGRMVNEPRRGGSCAAGLRPEAQCTISVIGRVRPGSALGPWTLTVRPSATDSFGVAALDLGPSESTSADGVPTVASLAPDVVLTEEPAIAVTATRGEIVNNGDGTYGVAHGLIVRNSGDVPIHDVTANDAVRATFGDRVVDYVVVRDDCSLVEPFEPLGTGATCEVRTEVVVRPLSELGPWSTTFDVQAVSPASNIVGDTSSPEDINFRETVAATADSELVIDANRSNGEYDARFVMHVENTSDVPLVGLDIADGLDETFGDTIIGRTVQLDECALVEPGRPLAPGARCNVEVQLLVRPGAELGPWSIPTTITAPSPSGKLATVELVSDDVSFTEAPGLDVDSSIELVENVGDGFFRVVVDLAVSNPGDVRLDDLSLTLDPEELFGDLEHRVDGVLSRSFDVSELYTTRESTEMLVAGQSIAAGGGGEVTVVFTVRPGDAVGPFAGSVDARGTSPALAETEARHRAAIDLPAISLVVDQQSITNNRDGSYTIETQYVLRNSGTTGLDNVRLGEDLFAIFQGASARTTSILADGIEVLAPDERDRRGELIQWDQSLRSDGEAIISTVTVVEPGNSLGPFEWGASASAISPAGTPVAISVSATEQVVFVEQPALIVEQRLLQRPEWSPSGRFDVSLAVDVTNDGDIELRNLQVKEDLLSAFGWQSTIIVRDIRSDALTVNSSYDGLGVPPQPEVELDADGQVVPYIAPAPFGDTSLLAGWDTLPAGETATIELDLTLAPEERGVYHTRVNVSARTPGGRGLGSEGEIIEATTLARLSVQGELGVAKRVLGEPEVRADGSVAVTYEILVQNAGPFPLIDVEVHDQLAQAFGVGSTFVTSRVRTDAGSPCTGKASSSYDGGTIDPVLVSGVALAPREQCIIQYDAFVIPGEPFPGPFRSSAFAVGSDPFSGTVIDDSTDGTDPDPDANQEPGDNDRATSVSVESPVPALAVGSQIESVEEAARDDWFDLTWTIRLTNEGPINVTQTRLVAALDDAWSVPYRIVDLRSDDVAVNTSFDGSDDIRLLRASNIVPVGETVEVTLVVSAPSPRGDELLLDLEFEARSVAGRPSEAPSATATSSTTVEVQRTADGGSLNPFATATPEERRLLILGLSVIALFVLLGLWALWRRWTNWREERRLRRRNDPPANEVLIDLRDGVIDLRDDAPERGRSFRRRSPHGRSRRRRGRREKVG